MEIRFSRKFVKQYNKSNLAIQVVFKRRIRLFMLNPHDPNLRNHTLKGKFKGHRSINITGDWRALYKEEYNKIVFVALGTHSQLYK